jgi:hypothetical protein
VNQGCRGHAWVGGEIGGHEFDAERVSGPTRNAPGSAEPLAMYEVPEDSTRIWFRLLFRQRRPRRGRSVLAGGYRGGTGTRLEPATKEPFEVTELAAHAPTQVRADRRFGGCEPGGDDVLLVVDDGAAVSVRGDNEAAFDGGFTRRDAGIAAMKAALIEFVRELTAPGQAREVPSDVVGPSRGSLGLTSTASAFTSVRSMFLISQMATKADCGGQSISAAQTMVIRRPM